MGKLPALFTTTSPFPILHLLPHHLLSLHHHHHLHLLLLLLLTSQHAFSQAPDINGNQPSSVSKGLQRADHCPGMVMAWSGRYLSSGSRSLLECLAGCGPDAQCLAIVFDSDNKQCHLCNDTARLDCSNMQEASLASTFYQTQVICDKEEEQPGPGGVCVCADGYRGNPCKPYIGDCAEGFAKGQFTTKSAVYSIHPRISEQPFSVYCKKMTNNVRTYIMDRRSTALNFNRTYADYRAGFGQLSGEHWLGLDRVYELTNSKTYELRVSVKLQNGSLRFMQYQQFNISSKDDGYRLWFNLSFPDIYLLGDCFTPLWRSQFSARDHDRDEDDTVNCAAKHGGGWWFRGKNCSTCNPTGPLLQPANGRRTGVDAEAFWTENLGDTAPSKLFMFLVYELTNSKTYELRVSAKLQNGSTMFMQYQQFNISSKEDGYRLWFNLSFADTYLLGDCFTPLWRSQFSARDHDRDEDDTVNCAAKHGGGWWFRGKNCSTCNPTGPLLKPPDGLRTNVDAEAFWTENLGDFVPVKLIMFLVDIGQ